MCFPGRVSGALLCYCALHLRPGTNTAAAPLKVCAEGLLLLTQCLFHCLSPGSTHRQNLSSRLGPACDDQRDSMGHPERRSSPRYLAFREALSRLTSPCPSLPLPRSSGQPVLTLTFSNAHSFFFLFLFLFSHVVLELHSRSGGAPSEWVKG